MTMHKYLKITENEYEQLRLEIWLNWCESKAMTTMEWQRLMANTRLNAWFNVELAKIERRFKHTTQACRYQTESEDLVQIYKKQMLQLHHIFLRPEQHQLRHDKPAQRYLQNELNLN